MVGKKLVYYGPGDIRLEEMPQLPECGEGCLLIKVEATAVCGSDVKAYRVGNPKMLPGRVMGHEFVGRVIEANNVEGFAIGDRVTMATTIGCGECYYCGFGKSNLCLQSKAMGFFYDGALASYVVIPRKALENGNVFCVPEDIPAQALALSEPTSCVLNDLSRIPVNTMSTALVIGLGALGILHAIVLREFGVGQIIGCDFPGKKKNLTAELGFETVTPDELEEKYLALSDGLGFELVVITAPDNNVQATAPKYARKGGYVSYFASLPASNEIIAVSSRLLHYNELVFIGTSDSTVEHVKAAVDVIGRQRDAIAKLVTVMPIDEVRAGIEGVIDMSLAKVVVMPNG